jgi:hypothetical protein
MTVPRPKPQQTRARFRYRPHLKPDNKPADPTFINILRHTRSKSPRPVWRDLAAYATVTPLEDPDLLEMCEFCYVHIDRFSPRSQDFIGNMMIAARRRKEISEKQKDYLVDLYEKLVRKRR